MLKAPLKQNATDTISTLSSRLASATLLEDRRASILGLRSFAKQYPASVASGSLKDLIECLRLNGAGLGKDGEGDVDTVRLVLETLLMLFNPDDSSPEASEDIALWLADNFSQRQDNITILLDLLDTTDYYARIYSLQLLTAISSSRPERTQECILHAPLGTARLVSTLDDGRDAVRNAALVLLVDLTNVSQTELQKLIAFEDAYVRIFNLIQAEGGLSEGGIVVQDCLSLLANLVRHSASNQSLFRETGCVPRFVGLVKQASIPAVDENDYARVDREKNAWGLLAVLRLFLEKGEISTKTNQDIFWRSGMAQLVLDLAFNLSTAPPIRASALSTCASMILSNAPIQEAFAASQVSLGAEPQPATNGKKRSSEQRKIYVIEALLSLALAPSANEPVAMRSAACFLIKSYFFGHVRIKQHFLQRAIAGFVDGEDEGQNILSTMMSAPNGSATSDASRYSYASDILSQLLANEPEAKAMLMAVSEGDAEKGEDVITAIQTLSSHLLSSLEDDLDPRISVAYLKLLATFLFESPLAINDCLAEGSSLMTALIATASQSQNSQIASNPIKSLLPGLCATLLGIVYEFSTKDSPISRRTLQPFLATRLGRQRYFEALMQLRQHPLIRDSEFAADGGTGTDGEFSLFDPTFIEFLKDEYGRLRRAIDKDPGIEVLARTDAGVDRDVLDDLRSQIAIKDENLQELEQEKLTSRQKSDQTEAEHRKEVQSIQSSQRSMEAEVERVKRINDALQRDHDAELSRLQHDMNSELERVHNSHKGATQTAQLQHEKELERVKGQHGASLASERSLWEDKSRKAIAAVTRDHQAKLDEVNAALEDREREARLLKQEQHTTRTRLDQLGEEHQTLKESNEQLSGDLQRTRGLQENLQQVNSKAMSRVKTLEEEAKQKESRLTGLVDELDRAAAEKTALDAKAKEMQDEMDGLKSELAAERKGYEELEAEVERAKKTQTAGGDAVKKTPQFEEKLKAMNTELAKAKEEEQQARTELEEMLMVMSELETKRDGYKDRLKKLGEEVSDDEGDDDDDDDDEEGDEEGDEGGDGAEDGDERGSVD